MFAAWQLYVQQRRFLTRVESTLQRSKVQRAFAHWKRCTFISCMGKQLTLFCHTDATHRRTLQRVKLHTAAAVHNRTLSTVSSLCYFWQRVVLNSSMQFFGAWRFQYKRSISITSFISKRNSRSIKHSFTHWIHYTLRRRVTRKTQETVSDFFFFFFTYIDQ